MVKPHNIPSSTDLAMGDVEGDWQEVRIIKWMSYRSVISRGQDPLECEMLAKDFESQLRGTG